MSVTVGFSQLPSSLLMPAPGTTKPDGTPADGSAEGGSEADLFSSLLAMLAPGAQPPAEDEPAINTATAVAAPNVVAPPAKEPVVADAPETPVPPDLTDLQKTFDGKALLRDFTDALKAAKTALDEGKPLDPALEKKLRETVAAIAAWFAGQPQLQAAPASVDVNKLNDLASGSTILPAAPATDLPKAPSPIDATPDADAAAPEAVSPATPAVPAGPVVEKTMYAQPVPAQLAALGDTLKDFATQLEKVAPDLAQALGKLAERLSVGDVSDEAMAQLGLTRSLGSTSPELEQIVAALTSTTRPDRKPAAADATASIAAPVLDLPDALVQESGARSVPPEVKTEAKTVVPRPETASPEPVAGKTEKAEPAVDTADLDADSQVNLDTGTSRPRESSGIIDARPATPVADSQKPDTPAPAAAPVAATDPDASAQAAAASSVTQARAIHAAYAAPVHQLNVPQVAFEVVRQFEAGNTRFQIRLDPPELGRVDVKLDVDKSGTVNARMVVERPETLDLMMRDQRALQQALQQAGLDTSRANLEFSLRQNPFAGSGGNMGQGGGDGGGQPGFGPYGPPVSDEGTEATAPTLYRGSASASGVNLFV